MRERDPKAAPPIAPAAPGRGDGDGDGGGPADEEATAPDAATGDADLLEPRSPEFDHSLRRPDEPAV